MLHSSKQTILPHETSSLYLTDGGVVTTFIFHKGIELPYFAVFILLQSEKGYETLRLYCTSYLEMAKKFKTGFVLESATWRASPDWIEKLGYPASTFQEVNTKALQFINDLKNEYEQQLEGPIVLSGCVGPRGDGYQPSNKMDVETAEQYHSQQISLFKENGSINVVTAFTLNYVEEAIGIVKACNRVELPCILSFTLETDGKLPSGMSLKDAIQTIDTATDTPPIYYMINCAHPKHFMNVFQEERDATWVKRIRGLRANSSCKSHAELERSTELDRGNVKEFSVLHKQLKQEFANINVFGGCCGTDEEHVEAIFDVLSSA